MNYIGVLKATIKKNRIPVHLKLQKVGLCVEEYINHLVDQDTLNQTKNRFWLNSSTLDCTHQTSSSLYVNDPPVFIWDV
ncbi:hypothetical protein Q8A67_016086 [Cirrhinus molitorella]|nr:hypothetical protein Q8A67_016086 [Cirrhinus molitorella]